MALKQAGHRAVPVDAISEKWDDNERRNRAEVERAFQNVDAALASLYKSLNAGGSIPDYGEIIQGILEDIQRIDGELSDIRDRLDTIEADLTIINQRLDAIEAHLTVIDGQITTIFQRLDTLDAHIVRIDGELDVIRGRLDAVEADIDFIKNTEIPRLEGLIAERMKWRGNWTQQEYQTNDVVLDAPWTMVANKVTTDRAGPQENNDDTYDIPEDNPAWVTQTFAGVVEAGRTYFAEEPITLVGYQIWPPDLGADVNTVIRTFLYTKPDQSDIVFQEISEPVLAEDQWNTVAIVQRLILPGTYFGVLINSLNSGTDTLVTGGWNRAANSNGVGTNPGNQAWGTRNNEANLRINYTDLDSVDRTTELQGIVAGSRIVMASTADPSQSMTWLINAPGTDYGTHIGFGNVTYEGGGSGGEPAVGTPCTMTATVPVPSPTQYVELAGGNPVPPPGTGNGYTQGILRLDGVDQPGADANAYGVRILLRTWTISPDWDLVSTYETLGGGGGGSGGGVTTFLGLEDTPPSWGPAYSVPAINAAADALDWSLLQVRNNLGPTFFSDVDSSGFYRFTAAGLPLAGMYADGTNRFTGFLASDPTSGNSAEMDIVHPDGAAGANGHGTFQFYDWGNGVTPIFTIGPTEVKLLSDANHQILFQDVTGSAWHSRIQANRTNDYITIGKYNAGTISNEYRLYSDPASSQAHRFYRGGAQVASIGPGGTTAPLTTTVMTREKGDTRYALSADLGNYLPLAGGTMTGKIELDGFPAFGATGDNQAVPKNYVGVAVHSDQETYEFDDLVGYEGTVYHCVVAHSAQPFSLTNFRPISAQVGTALELQYEWTTTTSGQVPDGQYGINNADPTLATQVRVSINTDLGFDVSAFWDAVGPGDVLGYQENTGGAEWNFYTVDGPGTLVAGTPDYYEIPVTYLGSDGVPENNRKGTVSLIGNPNNRLPFGGNTGDALVKSSTGDYDTEWADLSLTYLPLAGGTMTGELAFATGGANINFAFYNEGGTYQYRHWLNWTNSRSVQDFYSVATPGSVDCRIQHYPDNNGRAIRVFTSGNRGTEAYAFAAAGTSSNHNSTIISREKGDARYAMAAAFSVGLTALVDAIPIISQATKDSLLTALGLSVDTTVMTNGSQAGSYAQWEYDREQALIDTIDAEIAAGTYSGDPTAEATALKRRAEAVATQTYLVKEVLESDTVNTALDAARDAWVAANPPP